MACYKYNKGFTLVETIVVAAIATLLFAGLIVGFQTTLELISHNRAKITALSLANDRMEYIRSLSYDSVGTAGGIPPGSLPQERTRTHNGITYTERVVVDFHDDPADGTGGADANGITTDYKKVRISYQWEIGGSPQEIVLVSNIIPRSIESNAGGGTLRVKVFDADVVPKTNAEVRLINEDLSPPIDMTRYTNSEGVALIGGAPAGSGYEIVVTDTNHSTDRTYQATTTVPNPDTAPVTVAEADITTMNFFIDELSELQIRTLADKSVASFAQYAYLGGDIASSTDVAVHATSTTLATTSTGYGDTGVVFMQSVAPTSFDQWNTVQYEAVVPAQTEVRARVYTGTSTPVQVPEEDLPGNTVGFTTDFDISMLDTATYPEITLGFTLGSASTTQTPALHRSTVSYVESVVPAPDTALTVQGAKTIGTDGDGAPIYKHEYSDSTNGAGVLDLADVEWDAYRVAVPGQAIVEACPSNPVAVAPGEPASIDVVVASASEHALRVHVQYPDGTSVVGAEVTLTGPGGEETETTSGCGQVYYGALSEADYDISVSVPDGPDPAPVTVSVSGNQSEVISL